MGCLLDEGVLQGKVRNSATAAPITGASVRAELDASHIWTTTTLADGSFQLLVAPGDYTVDVAAPFYLPKDVPDVTALRARETTLNVGLQPCDAGVSFTNSPILPSVDETITFAAGASSLPPYYYEWDFGDGSTGSGQTVTHAYTVPGLYSVSLEIESLCPSTVVRRSIPVQLPALFFPLVPVPLR
jgi:PKD repeat protein